MSSITKAQASMLKQTFTPRHVGPLLTHVYTSSPAKALTLSKALLQRTERPERTQKERQEASEREIRSMVRWGAEAGATQRHMVCTAFKQSGMNLFLIHGIGEFTKQDARAYMKEYFAAGGDLESVAQWLQIAGGVLQQKRPKAAGTAGDAVSSAVNWVKNKVEDAVDAASDMINTVADAVKAAGKSLADVVTTAASWAAGKVADLARALLEAGHSVASLLSEAVKHGMSALTTFVKGVIQAGRAVGEAIAWAVSKTADVLKTVVVAAYHAGVLVGQILVNVIRNTPAVIRTVLEGLLAVGVQLVDAVVAVCKDIGQAFRKGFFQGLLALGKAPLDLLKAALKAGAAILALAFAVFLDIWGRYRPLSRAERQEARRVFGWSIDLDRVGIAVASIPVDILEWVNGQRPFTTMYFINFASGRAISMGTLIHELTHVWQGVVAGPVYMVEALESQYFGRGYNVTDDDLQKAGGNFEKLEREQQAMVVELYWRGRWGGESIAWQKYEPYAKQVYTPEPVTSLVYHHIVPVARRVQPALIRLTAPR